MLHRLTVTNEIAAMPVAWSSPTEPNADGSQIDRSASDRSASDCRCIILAVGGAGVELFGVVDTLGRQCAILLG